jgi:AraC-like DNA-binding protein
MLNIVNRYTWNEFRKILTPSETGVEALSCFGMKYRQHAEQPLPRHIHRDRIEIVFMLNGFQVYEASGASFTLSGMDVFVAYPDEPHSSDGCLENVSDLIWLQIDLSPELPFFGLSGDSADMLRDALRSLPRVFRGDDALRQLLQESFSLLASDAPFDRFCGQQLLVCALQRMKRLSLQPPTHRPERISSAVEYIRDHFCEPVSLEDVAAACGLSLSRFKVCFKAETGISPREYINQLKIRQAMLLLDEGRSVTDVSMALGFTTPNYFSVLFKKHSCLTPIEYLRSRTAAKST